MALRYKFNIPNSLWDLCAGVLLIAVGVVLVQQGYETRTGDAGSFLPGAPGTIGRLKREEGWVRFRPERSLFWRDLGAEVLGISDGDRIFTGDSGTALYSWSDGSIRILPRSFLVIRSDQPSHSWNPGTGPLFLFQPQFEAPRRIGHIEMSEGEITLLLESGAKSVIFHGLRKPLELSARVRPAEMQITMDGEGAERTVRITARSGGGIHVGDSTQSPMLAAELTPGQTATLSETRPPEISRAFLTAAAPANHATLYRVAAAPGEALPVDFRWRRASEASRAVRAEVELVPGGVHSAGTPAEAEVLSIGLKEGDYRWRLLLRGAAAGEPWRGPWQWFRLLDLRSPEMIGPADAARFPVRSDGRQEVRLRWSALDPSLRGEVELTREGEGSASKTILGNRFGADVELPAGSYGWRTRSSLDRDRRSDWGPARGFEVGQPAIRRGQVLPIPSAPLPVASPLPSVPLPEPSPMPRIIPREPVLRAAEAKVQRRFALPRSAPSARPSSSPSPLPSPAVSASPKPLIPPTPLTKEPPDGAELSLKETVVFSWPVEKLGDSYRIQISLAPNFSTVIVDRTVRTNYLLFSPRLAAPHYWRIMTVSKERSGAAEWSRTRKLEIR